MVSSAAVLARPDLDGGEVLVFQPPRAAKAGGARCAAAPQTTYQQMKDGGGMKIHYGVVEHDGGWTYKLGNGFSEAFPSRATALAASAPTSRQGCASGGRGRPTLGTRMRCI